MLLFTGCEDETARITGTTGESDEANEIRSDYRMILAGAISDTLRGRAVFGHVMLARSRTEQFVIKLETGVDFVGGMFITRNSIDLPETGTHQLAAADPESDAAPLQGYYVVYREGLLRHLRSRGGSVTFDVVTDTLISGTLQATLAGMVSTRTGMRPGEVHVSGRFSAHSGIVGFLIGL